MREYVRKALWQENADGERVAELVREDSIAKSASIAPLFGRYRRAWDPAQAEGALLKRLEHAAEALALTFCEKGRR